MLRTTYLILQTKAMTKTNLYIHHCDNIVKYRSLHYGIIKKLKMINKNCRKTVISTNVSNLHFSFHFSYSFFFFNYCSGLENKKLCIFNKKKVTGVFLKHT